MPLSVPSRCLGNWTHHLSNVHLPGSFPFSKSGPMHFDKGGNAQSGHPVDWKV